MSKNHNNNNDNKNILKWYLIIFFIINLLGFSFDFLLGYLNISNNIFNKLLNYSGMEIFISIITYSFMMIALYYIIKIYYFIK